MRRWRSASAFVVLGLVLPTLAHAACQVQSIELPVKMVGSRAVATVGINGTPVPLTVDSGAFFSFADRCRGGAAQAARASAVTALRVEGLTGKVDARMTTVDKLQLFKRRRSLASSSSSAATSRAPARWA